MPSVPYCYLVKFFFSLSVFVQPVWWNKVVWSIAIEALVVLSTVNGQMPPPNCPPPVRWPYLLKNEIKSPLDQTLPPVNRPLRSKWQRAWLSVFYVIDRRGIWAILLIKHKERLNATKTVILALDKIRSNAPPPSRKWGRQRVLCYYAMLLMVDDT